MRRASRAAPGSSPYVSPCASLARDVHDDAARMAACAMLPEIDRLPGAEGELAVRDRDRFRRAGQRGAGMCRHVVRTLGVVLPAPGLGCELGHPALQIA